MSSSPRKLSLGPLISNRRREHINSTRPWADLRLGGRGGGFKCFLAQTASGVSLMVSLAFQVSADSRGCLPGYKLLGVFYATFDCQWCVTTQILPGLSSSVCSHLVCGKCLGKWLRALDLLLHLFLPGNLVLQTCISNAAIFFLFLSSNL